MALSPSHSASSKAEAWGTGIAVLASRRGHQSFFIKPCYAMSFPLAPSFDRQSVWVAPSRWQDDFCCPAVCFAAT
jgi:hypothetical protein